MARRSSLFRFPLRSATEALNSAALETFLHENVTPTEWRTPTLLNSWVDFGSPYQTARFRREGNTVHIEGLIKSGTTTITTPIFVLPDEYRPYGDLIIGVAINGGGGSVAVTSAGSVQAWVVSPTWTSLTCSFQVV